MSEPICMFHGATDCPAACELETLDDQIDGRLRAESLLAELHDKIDKLLASVEDIK